MSGMTHFSFDDQSSGWNNPNKTKAQEELLAFRGNLLNQRMKYDLDYKVILAKRRIQAAVDKYGVDNCYVSFSGGKDSTILSHIALSMGLKLEHTFSNTRLEYPECVAFTKEWCRNHGIQLNMVLPDVLPLTVWKKHGYPMFSKESAEILERIRLMKKVNPKKLRKVTGILQRLGYKGKLKTKDGRICVNVKKVKQFLKSKGIKLSAQCCYYLKKKPMKEWQKKSGKYVAIMGVRAQESQMRRTVWVRKGCIYETKDQVVVHPLIFFRDEDIEAYAKKHNIRFADIYYKGLRRNGCFCCGFGCHLTEENNFVTLKRLYPHLVPAVMNHWGFGKICKKCGVKID